MAILLGIMGSFISYASSEVEERPFVLLQAHLNVTLCMTGIMYRNSSYMLYQHCA
jgi:hypothetical protein